MFVASIRSPVACYGLEPLAASTVWTKLLLFDDEHAVCEPKRLRYRLLHVAGKLTRHARQLTLHLPADWPWAAAIARAFKRLAALPA